MNKTFKRKTINGRNFQFLAIPGTDLFKFEIVNMIGSNIERAVNKETGKNVYGLSHFIEHLGFRAPKDYSTEQLMKLVKTEGTYNASTDHDRINYWFKTTSDRADTAVRLVCNYALNDLKNISEEEFNTEKKVVYNEAKRYADDDQTMFYFNTTPALCGYHPEDNVIGIPETIDTFTIEDAITIKDIFLTHGETFINVTHDPEVLSEEELTEMIISELDRFPHPDDTPASEKNWLDIHNDMLGQVSLTATTSKNESEQAMTGVVLDVITNDIAAARTANAYLSRYSDTSLTDIIREQNGLTYGIQFNDGLISYKSYTFFMCDVSRGDEDKLIELFKESIDLSVDNFTEEAHNELMKIQHLKRTMAYVNLQNYENIHWTSIWFPEMIDTYESAYAENIAIVPVLMDVNDSSYEQVKEYLVRLQTAVQANNYGLVTNA